MLQQQSSEANANTMNSILQFECVMCNERPTNEFSTLKLQKRNTSETNIVLLCYRCRAEVTTLTRQNQSSSRLTLEQLIEEQRIYINRVPIQQGAYQIVDFTNQFDQGTQKGEITQCSDCDQLEIKLREFDNLLKRHAGGLDVEYAQFVAQYYAKLQNQADQQQLLKLKQQYQELRPDDKLQRLLIYNKIKKIHNRYHQ